jgi:hypothetical protein
MPKPTVDLFLAIHHDTGKALLVSEAGDKDKAVWLPLSQIEVGTDRRPSQKDQNIDLATITLPEWLAEKEGLA